MGQAVFTSNGTWVCPNGVTLARIECYGQAGVGQTGGASAGGTGGGGGAYARKNSLAVTPGHSYTVTCSSPATGTSFSTTGTVSADYGRSGVAGGAGGSTLSCIGDVIFGGGNGGTGAAGGGGGGGSSGDAAGAGNNGTNATAGGPGTGGAQVGNGGAGGNGGGISAAGSPGQTPGGGGGGGGKGTPANDPGGAAGLGKVVISWSSPQPVAMSTWIEDERTNVDGFVLQNMGAIFPGSGTQHPVVMPPKLVIGDPGTEAHADGFVYMTHGALGTAARHQFYPPVIYAHGDEYNADALVTLPPRGAGTGGRQPPPIIPPMVELGDDFSEDGHIFWGTPQERGAGTGGRQPPPIRPPLVTLGDQTNDEATFAWASEWGRGAGIGGRPKPYAVPTIFVLGDTTNLDGQVSWATPAGRGAGTGGRQPPPIITVIIKTGEDLDGPPAGESLLMQGPGFHRIFVMPPPAPTFTMGDQTDDPAVVYQTVAPPFYHHKFGSVAAVVSIGDDTDVPGSASVLHAQAFRQIVPPPLMPPSIKTFFDVWDVTGFDGQAMFVHGGALKPGLARPKIIATQITVGDQTSFEGEWHSLRAPPLWVPNRKMIVSVGDDMNVDASLSFPGLFSLRTTATYSQQILPLVNQSIVGDQYNDDAVVIAPGRGVPLLPPVRHPHLPPWPVVTVGEDMGLPEFVQQSKGAPVHLVRPIAPLVSIGDQTSFDGSSSILDAQPLFHPLPGGGKPAILAAGDLHTDLGLPGVWQGTVVMASVAHPFHTVAPRVPGITLGDETQTDAMLGLVRGGSPVHQVLYWNQRSNGVGDSYSVEGSAVIPLSGQPKRQPVPHIEPIVILGDETSYDGQASVLHATPRAYTTPKPPAYYLGDQTDVPGSSLVIGAKSQPVLPGAVHQQIVVGDQTSYDGIVTGSPTMGFAAKPWHAPPLQAVKIHVTEGHVVDSGGFAEIVTHGPVRVHLAYPVTIYSTHADDMAMSAGGSLYHLNAQFVHVQIVRNTKDIPPIGQPEAVWIVPTRQRTFQTTLRQLWWQETVSM